MIHRWLQACLPHHVLSRLYGRLATIEQPAIRQALIKTFIWYYGVDLQAAIREDIAAYRSFNDFFTRELKPALRPLAPGATQLISPVDGVVSQFGAIQQGELLQAKGATYSLRTLLGNDEAMTASFQDGHFMTLYLAPKDYHRVHMPLAGQLQRMLYVPGRLFSVRKKTLASIPHLFTRNERVICLFDTVAGPMAVILVGAMIVASIATAWHGAVAPAKGRTIQQWNYSQEEPNRVVLEKGAELGHFEVGSTVIVLLPQGHVQWSDEMTPDQSVRFGQALGSVQSG